jgi:hypothetical protein
MRARPREKEATMSQILNIVRKDIRGLRLEILLVLAATIAFVWVRGPDWLPTSEQAFSGLPHLNYSMEELLQVLRCLLIARVVHKESLVGDRQFWITRPYSWRQLLAAKTLFISLLAVVPSVIADCALLHFAGYSPLSYVPQLIGHQALLAALFIAPFFAIASVTRNLWQFAAPSICLFAFSFLLIRPQLEVLGWFRFPLIMTIVIAGAVVTIVMQYARRRIAAARLVMISAVAAVATVSLLPLPDAVVRLRYPVDQTPVTLAFDPAPFKIAEDFDRALEVPVKIEGIPEGCELQLDGARVRIEGPEGKTSDSGWQITNLFHDKEEGTLAAYIDRRDFDAFKWMKVNVRVTVAITLLHPGNTFTFTLRDAPFSIPDLGNCRWVPDMSMCLRCLLPFRGLPPLVSGATKFGPDCICVSRPIPGSALKELQATLLNMGKPRYRIRWPNGYFDNISLNPLVGDLIAVSGGGGGGMGKGVEFTYRLCSGTEVVVTTLRPGARILRNIDIHDIRLVDYWPKYAR